jgi:hypothetical protein
MPATAAADSADAVQHVVGGGLPHQAHVDGRPGETVTRKVPVRVRRDGARAPGGR